jgi:hypothetical protein
MRVYRFLLLVLCVCLGPAVLPGAGVQAQERVPLFNGRDLTGWVLVNTPPDTWSVQDGMLVCTGRPIGEMRTDRMFQNFELELEWRHMVPAGNAGVFIWADDITARGVPFHRGIEVQVLEHAYGNTESHTTHGDIFPIHGATMKPINGRGGGSRAFPTEERGKPSPEWNHYRIVCQDGNISLAVNGKVVTQGTECSPRKGYICLESEGGVVHYRNLWIKELPDTPIDPEHVAIADRGYRSIYSGLDLRGWKTAEAAAQAWQPKDWVLNFDGSVAGNQSRLETDESLDLKGFVIDFRFSDANKSQQLTVHLPGGEPLVLRAQDDPRFAKALEKTGSWNRLEGTFANGRLQLKVNQQAFELDQAGGPGTLALESDGPLQLCNLFVR